MASGLNEIQACMDTVVDDFGSVHAILLLEIRVEPRLNVLDNGFPARRGISRVKIWCHAYKLPVIVVDKITETGSINHG